MYIYSEMILTEVLKNFIQDTRLPSMIPGWSLITPHLGNTRLKQRMRNGNIDKQNRKYFITAAPSSHDNATRNILYCFRCAILNVTSMNLHIFNLADS